MLHSESIKQIIKSNIPLLLEGPTGSGKTYHIMRLAEEAKTTLHVINVSGELTVDTILGHDTLKEGTVYWVDGVLTNALRKGEWVLMDELNTALPEVLTVINGLLDDSRSVTLPSGERVTAPDTFRFICTQNPASGDYAGTQRLNDALLNRLIKIEVGYMRTSEEMEALKAHTKLSDSSILQLVKVAQYTREEMDTPLSTRDLVKTLRLKERGGMSLRDALSTVCLAKYSREEYAKLQEYHSSVINEIQSMVGSTEIDPFTRLKEWQSELEKRETQLRKEKEDLSKAVRAELLKELLQEV